jgi:hypothetical protein
MKRALADVARGEGLFAGCALDASGLLSYEVDRFKDVVAFGSLNCGRVGDCPDALGSRDCLFPYIAKQDRGAGSHLDAVSGALAANSNAFYSFSDVFPD